MRKCWLSPVIVAALLLCGPGRAQAPELDAPSQDSTQERGRARGGNLPPGLRSLLEEVFVARMSRELRLDDEQTVVLVRHYTEAREAIVALRGERARALRDLRELGDSDGSEARVAETLEQVIALERRMVEVRIEHFERATEGMDAKQSAMLYLFFQDFESQMRRFVQQARDRFSQERGGPLRTPQRSGRPPRSRTPPAEGPSEPESPPE